MHLREDYVKICKTCTKRASSMQKGLICSLTQDHAAFETEKCPDYETDSRAEIRVKAAEKEKKAENKSAFWGGVTATTLGGIWLLTGLAYGLLFLWSIVLIVSGVIILVRISIKKSNARANQKKGNDKILDDTL